ncbi:MAG TPA: Fic family protein [archaeon]|nr:Fic family protein [archaeon]
MIDKQKIKYPTIEEIVQANYTVIKEINVSRKDYHRIYHRDRIIKILEEMKKLEGDLYDKAVFLLKNLIISHPFGSANRRTAYVVTHTFICNNTISLLTDGLWRVRTTVITWLINFKMPLVY